MENKTHGGARSSAGRKPIDEKLRKKQIPLYVEQWKLDAIGGFEQLQALCYGVIDKAAKVKK